MLLNFIMGINLEKENWRLHEGEFCLAGSFYDFSFHLMYKNTLKMCWASCS